MSLWMRILTVLLLLSAPAGAFDPADLQRLSEGLQCPQCDLSGADLSGAALGYANLNGANLAGADLTDANLRGANLADAELRGARLCRTTMPDGRVEHRNCP